GADHDAVDVAGEDTGRVPDGLAAAELDVAGREEQGVAAELERPDLEGHAGARGALLEDHRERLAGERLAAILAELDAPGQVEQVVQLVGGEVRDLEEIALVWHVRPMRRCLGFGAQQSTGVTGRGARLGPYGAAGEAGEPGRPAGVPAGRPARTSQRM